MTPSEFESLSTHEQFVALYDYGKYLGHRKERNYYYTFYRLEEIYLEFKFNAISRLIEGYKIFPDPNLPVAAGDNKVEYHEYVRERRSAAMGASGGIRVGSNIF